MFFVLVVAMWVETGPVWAMTSRKTSSDTGKSVMSPLNRFPQMVQEHFVSQVRQIEKSANRRRAKLKTRADAEAYVRDIRAKIQQSFGPWPQKSPLNPRIMSVIHRDAYKIEKVIFESRPGFLVTANLYIPKGRQYPLPGVVGTCGHSTSCPCWITGAIFGRGH